MSKNKMKKVLNNSSDVIHLFAQRSQSEARCSNVYFNSINKIYSYGSHYLLGEFINNHEGNEAIMINDCGYSATTAKHISQIRQATRQYKQFFIMSTDAKKVLYQLENFAKKLQSARKKEIYITPALNLIESYNKWLQWSGVFNLETNQINLISAVFTGSDITEYFNNKQKAIKQAEKEQIKRNKLELNKNVKKFEQYKINSIYNTLGEDFLRVSNDGLMVETSQGVKVDIREAKILYKMILAGKDIKGVKISDYTVISINGTLKIGCHNINMKSVHKVGKSII